MYGNQHFLLSVLTVAAIVSPALIFTGDASLLIIIIAGGFGSLLPDGDAEDSALAHNKIRGTSRFVGYRLARVINNVFGTVNFVLYPVAKWLVFKPYVLFLGVKAEHRGAFHTVYAGLFASFILTLILSAALWYAKAFNFTYSAFVFAGLLLGFLLHLVEDACTVSGIGFLFPFQSYFLRGNHHTNGDSQFLPNSQIIVLLVLSGLPYLLWFLSNPTIKMLPPLPFWAQQAGVLALLLCLWLAFLKLYGVRRDRRSG